MTAVLVLLQVRHFDRSGELKISEAKSLSIEQKHVRFKVLSLHFSLNDAS